MKVRLFVKTQCGWCDLAANWLDQRGIPYEKLDVSIDKNAYDEMLRLTKQTFAPVIDVDGKILADFGPEELAAFWEKISPVRESA